MDPRQPGQALTSPITGALMPFAAPHPCGVPGCGTLIPRGARRCEPHERKREAEDRDRRGTSTQRGYDSRWTKARRTFLSSHPLCRRCEGDGTITAASVVDHIRPHKGDQALFWDTTNWQPLCAPCHNRKTATEDGGFGRKT